LIVFLTAMAVAAALVPICRHLARMFGLMAIPHPDKSDIRPTPLLGGMAVFAGFVLTVLLAYFAVLSTAGDGILAALIPDAIRRYASGMLQQGPRLAAILTGGLLMLIAGLIDDKRAMSPQVKLAVQAAVIIIVVSSGVRLSLFISNEWIAGLITVLWILTVTNAINLLDNTDGLAGGVAAIASLFFLLTAIQYGQFFVSALLAAFMGAVVGFLLFNLHPASIFMGDAGSMFIGYMLGVLTILGTYHRPEDPTAFPVVVPLVVLAIPLYEIVTVMGVRLKKGLSPFRPSKDHFSHRMQGLGLGVRSAVSFVCLVTACTGVAALLLPQLNAAGALLDLLLVGLILTIVALLEIWAGRRNQKKETGRND